MNVEIVVATGNQHKVKEFRELFKGCPIIFYSLKDLNLNVDVEENGTTYKENALIKARAISKIVNFPVIADDSGIEIKAMNNEPGIYSARFADSFGGSKSANLEVLKRLKDAKDRTATFYCDIALVYQGQEYVFEGICPGKILEEITGENGFGYDPIFFSDEANMPMGLATDEIKNTFSHRAKAAKKLKTFLKIKNYKF